MSWDRSRMGARAGRYIALLLCLLASGPAASATNVIGSFSRPLPGARPIAIEHVTIVGIGGAPARPDFTVVVAANRIVSVGPADRIRLPANAERVDGAGKFLIPGLWDMHVHIFNNAGAPGTDNHLSYFPLFIANGVTGVRDMWTDPDDIGLLRRWRRDINSGRAVGPRVIPASEIIDGVPPVWPTSVSVADAAQARAAVRRAKASGASFIKVLDNLSREAYFAIADESRRVGLPFAGHVPFAIRPSEAADAGQKSIEHLTAMPLGCSSQEDHLFALGHLDRAAVRLMIDSYDAERCRRLAEHFAAKGTWHDPTLVVVRARQVNDPAYRTDPRLRFVAAAQRQSWIEFDADAAKRDTNLRADVFRARARTLADLRAAGVRILAGTDLGNPHIYAGSSLDDELELLVTWGLTPPEALAAATINPARYLGVERRLGTVDKDKFADLVLLDADPTLDIANIRRVAGVMSNGRYFDRASLVALTDTAAREIARLDGEK